MTELSDELLVAYVDGQLARDQSEAIERVLNSDSVAARRVEALKDAHRQLEAAFEAMLAGQLAEIEQVPDAAGTADWKPAASPPEAGEAKWFGVVPAVCAAIAALLIGAGGGWVLHDRLTRAEVAPVVAAAPPAPTWREDVARAHGLFSRASLEVGLESQGNLDLVRFQLATSIGPSLVLPDLREQGLTFKRAQVLQRGSEPFAQIAYLPRNGPPVALYVRSGETVAQDAAAVAPDEVRAATYSAGGLTYMLAGRIPEKDFNGLLDAVKLQIIVN